MSTGWLVLLTSHGLANQMPGWKVSPKIDCPSYPFLISNSLKGLTGTSHFSQAPTRFLLFAGGVRGKWEGISQPIKQGSLCRRKCHAALSLWSLQCLSVCMGATLSLPMSLSHWVCVCGCLSLSCCVWVFLLKRLYILCPCVQGPLYGFFKHLSGDTDCLLEFNLPKPGSDLHLIDLPKPGSGAKMSCISCLKIYI